MLTELRRSKELKIHRHSVLHNHSTSQAEQKLQLPVRRERGHQLCYIQTRPIHTGKIGRIALSNTVDHGFYPMYMPSGKPLASFFRLLMHCAEL